MRRATVDSNHWPSAPETDNIGAFQEVCALRDNGRDNEGAEAGRDNGRDNVKEDVVELLRAVERGDAATAWERAQRVAQAVLEGEAVRLARAVLAGGPLALHEAVKLAQMVGEGAVGEDKNEGEGASTTSDIVRWTLRHTRAPVRS